MADTRTFSSNVDVKGSLYQRAVAVATVSGAEAITNKTISTSTVLFTAPGSVTATGATGTDAAALSAVTPVHRILSGARAVLIPTQYLEPFGNVSAEAQLCGTPVISTDYGAFVESVEHGVSGYRCSTLGEFIQAIDLAGALDRRVIRQRAVHLYGSDAADRAYDRYFRRLDLVGGDGWRALVPGLTPAIQEHRPYGQETAEPCAV